MLCAGATVYAALRKSNAKSGQWVVIAGAGGGLGDFGIQIGAKGMAMRTIGVDHGSKGKLVMDCGAEAFVDITKFDDKTIGEEVKRITGGVGASAVIVCTASNRAYAQRKPSASSGRGEPWSAFGMPEGGLAPIAGAFPSVIVTRNQKIVGSAVGNQKEAIEVLEMTARGIVKTHYKIEKMDNLTEIFKEMSDLKMQGRFVLDLE
jgi:alcohol dehydrogenase, propanol-preferring